MNYEAMPKIRLEVESMKASIIAHLGARGSELGEQLDAEITRAIDSYDWQGKVSSIVHAALDEKIASYFKYGDGAKAVEDAISEGFKAVMSHGAGE